MIPDFKVIAGGMSGADQAALFAARRFGIPTGGFAAKGWLIKAPDGKLDIAAPWLADFGLVECGKPGYPARTAANVAMADGVLWFGDPKSPGAIATFRNCDVHCRPTKLVLVGVTTPAYVVRWLVNPKVRTLMVAGNRETEGGAFGDRVGRFLGRVFSALGYWEVS